jgi:predicted transposase/invertase (TIGR01784 family)
MITKRKIIDDLILFDDRFASLVFQNNTEAAHLLISTVIGFDDFTIEHVNTQEEIIPGLTSGKKVILDVLAKDDTGRNFNIEIQNIPKDFGPRRARYYASAADIQMLEAGQNYSELADRYTIIFLSQDPDNSGIPLRTYRYMEVNSHTPLNDGSCIIYVNGSYQNDDAIGHLVADMHQSDPDKMHYPILAESTGFYKKAEEGRRTAMSELDKLIKEIAEEAAKEAAEKAKEEGRKEALEQTNRELAQMNLQLAEMAKSLKQKEILLAQHSSVTKKNRNAIRRNGSTVRKVMH